MIRVSAQRLGLPADSEVRDIARACARAGGRALVVGGWVRDGLRDVRGADRRDLDLEVYGLSPDSLEALLGRFGRVRRVGRSFPILLLAELGLDVSLPRRRAPEASGAASAAGSVGDVWANFDPDQDFEQASLGRDLRINAMGWDPLTEELLDPHAAGGRRSGSGAGRRRVRRSGADVRRTLPRSREGHDHRAPRWASGFARP